MECRLVRKMMRMMMEDEEGTGGWVPALMVTEPLPFLSAGGGGGRVPMAAPLQVPGSMVLCAGNGVTCGFVVGLD